MVGEHLHMDIVARSVASPGGRHVSVRSKDDVTGDEQMHTCVSKLEKVLFDCMCLLIHPRYSVRGHRTRIISQWTPIKLLSHLHLCSLPLVSRLF